MKKKFKPGDRVMLTAGFLKLTGQIVGGEGFSRWTVMPCDCDACKTNRFVATDEISVDGRYRHIKVGNLILEGRLDPSSG